jgi:type II secretory pathway component PulF
MSDISRPHDPSRILRATILMVCLHGVLGMTWLFGLFFFVPRAEKTFRDFAMKLPALTELVLSMSRVVANYPLFVGLMAIVFLGVDGICYYQLRRSVSRLVSNLWSLVLFLVSGLVLVGTAIAILNPLIALQEALSR